MAEDEHKITGQGIATGPRHVYGPRALSALVPNLTRPAFRRRSPGSAQIMADWEVIVGPALARVTAPRRLSNGTLTLACAGPIALELQHMSGELISRINTRIGGSTVKAIRFEQAPTEAPTAPAIPPSNAEAIRAAEEAVTGLPDSALRAALNSLGRAVLAARPQPKHRPPIGQRKL